MGVYHTGLLEYSGFELFQSLKHKKTIIFTVAPRTPASYCTAAVFLTPADNEMNDHAGPKQAQALFLLFLDERGDSGFPFYYISKRLFLLPLHLWHFSFDSTCFFVVLKCY